MATTCHWQCGVCHASFITEQAVAQHLRDAHAPKDAKFVGISATTWSRDSHGLFDQESVNQHHHQRLAVPLLPAGPPLRFLRDGSELRLKGGLMPSPPPGGGSPMHAQLTWHGATPVVERTPKNSNRSQRRSSVWLSVGPSGHTLKQGDMAKVGRYIIQIRQICLEGPARIPNFSSIEDAGIAPISQLKLQAPPEESEQSHTCRICLSGEGESEESDAGSDELIMAPCLCKGAIQRVHLGCLRRWLGVRYSITNRMSHPQAAYTFKPPGCEICRTEFPATFQATRDTHTESVSLLPTLPEVEPPFIVLSLPKCDRERPHGERCVFAPGGVSDAILRIGRGHDAQVRLSDVSVSRVHSTIQLVNGSFVLSDCNSKFRTVVLPTGPEALREGVAEPLSVQMGRTVLSLTMLDPDSQQTPGEATTPSAVASSAFFSGTSQEAVVTPTLSPARLQCSSGGHGVAPDCDISPVRSIDLGSPPLHSVAQENGIVQHSFEEAPVEDTRASLGLSFLPCRCVECGSLTRNRGCAQEGLVYCLDCYLRHECPAVQGSEDIPVSTS